MFVTYHRETSRRYEIRTPGASLFTQTQSKNNTPGVTTMARLLISCQQEFSVSTQNTHPHITRFEVCVCVFVLAVANTDWAHTLNCWYLKTTTIHWALLHLCVYTKRRILSGSRRQPWLRVAIERSLTVSRTHM